MEYCYAGSVTDIMSKTKRPLTETQIALVCEATLRGLDYLHSTGKLRSI
jgi:serine/threonine protein kinase